MIINTEWGSFGDNDHNELPRTFYDNRLDRESINAGIHLFEKMVSGLYLGELVRNILIDFLDRRILFNAQYTPQLNTPYSFEASYMSTIERDDSQQLDETKHILETIMGLPSTTVGDRRLVKRICKVVGQRAAQLVAAAMSAIIDKRDGLEHGVTLSKST